MRPWLPGKGVREGVHMHTSAMGKEGRVRGRCGSLPDPDQPYQVDVPLQPRLELRAFQQRRQDDHSPPLPPP